MLLLLTTSSGKHSILNNLVDDFEDLQRVRSGHDDGGGKKQGFEVSQCHGVPMEE